MADKWTWSKDDPNQNSIAGDITRLFRAEGIDQPGVLHSHKPSESALLFSREAIQNSWDAAIELRKILDFKIPQFVLRLRFLEVIGEEKAALVKAMGLRELAKHLDHESTTPRKTRRAELGLFEDDCLSALSAQDEPLKLLLIEEQGAVGMYGSWDASNSRMMFALNRVGYNIKMDGAGGSFGYGKAGLIQASRIRTLFAYSCFQEVKDEPAVTRRFLGAAYLGQHRHKGTAYTGWVRLGDQSENGAKPFVNEQADLAAQSIGLEVRTSSKVEQLGSTVVVVDPQLEPDELCAAIERNWWPSLLARDGLRVEIIKADGSRVVPRARKDDPILGPFISAYECADKKKENLSNIEVGRDLGSYSPQGDSRHFGNLGRIGLVADPDGWSFPATEVVENEQTGDVEPQKSLIALVRGPRMVIQYWSPQPSTAPFIRGVLIASDDIDDLLRQTEPKAHDKWDERVKEPGIDVIAPRVAGEVMKRMKLVVSEFRQRFRPPPPPPGPVNLPLLDDLMRLLNGKKPQPPRTAPRPFTLQFSSQPRRVKVSESEICVSGKASFGLSEHIDSDKANVELTIVVAFVEDGRAGALCQVDFKVPAGFQMTAQQGYRYTFEGLLYKTGSRAEFEFTSAPYASEWTTQVVITGKLQ